MKKMENKLTIHTNVDRDTLELFDRQYHGCRSRFIRNALELASNNKLFFDKVFFKDLLANNGNYIPIQ